MGSGSQQMEEEMGRGRAFCLQYEVLCEWGDSGRLGVQRDTSVNSHCQKEYGLVYRN